MVSAEVPLVVTKIHICIEIGTKTPRRQEQQGQGSSGRKSRDDVRSEGGSTLAKGEHFLSELKPCVWEEEVLGRGS